MGAVLIGGGYALLPILEEEIVKKRGWAKSEEMADFYALAQLLPGVIALNTSMLVGQKLRGFKGNLASSLGLIFVPFILIAIYAVLYSSTNTMDSMITGERGAS
jgi:chromate transporter